MVLLLMMISILTIYSGSSLSYAAAIIALRQSEEKAVRSITLITADERVTGNQTCQIDSIIEDAVLEFLES